MYPNHQTQRCVHFRAHTNSTSHRDQNVTTSPEDINQAITISPRNQLQSLLNQIRSLVKEISAAVSNSDESRDGPLHRVYANATGLQHQVRHHWLSTQQPVAGDNEHYAQALTNLQHQFHRAKTIGSDASTRDSAV